MFPWHESTRRSFFRGAFLLLCVLPTLLVASLILWCQGAPYHRWMNQQLAAATNWRVECREVLWPRSGVSVYGQVTLSDRETGQPIASAHSLEVERLAEKVVVRLVSPQLHTSHLEPLWELVEGVLRQSPSQVGSIELAPADWTAQLEHGPRTFSGLSATIQASTQDTVAIIETRIDGLQMSRPAQLWITRDRRPQIPETEWQLQTAETPLPTSLLAELVPALSRMGDRAEFSGRAVLRSTPGGWNAEIKGSLVHLDLLELMAPFPFPIHAEADVRLEDVRIRENRLRVAEGSLVTTPGMVPTQLLVAAKRSLDCRISKATELRGGRIRFQQAALHFALDDHQRLRLTGACDRAPKAIFTEAGDEGVVPLLFEPDSPQPAVALVRLLVPENEIEFPATKQTAWLAGWLPLPDVTTARGTPPRGHLQGVKH